MKRGPKGPRQTVDLRSYQVAEAVDLIRLAYGCNIRKALQRYCAIRGALVLPPFISNGIAITATIHKPRYVSFDAAKQAYERVHKRLQSLA